MGLILASGLGFCMIYGTLGGARELNVKHIELYFKNLPPAFDNYKITQLSDIHVGNSYYSKKLIERTQSKIDENHCDMLLFTGDLVNNFSYEINPAKDVLKKLSAQRKCFSILGNHDYGNYTKWENVNSKMENFDSIVSFHEELGFKLLRNENIVIKNGEDSIFLVGVENWGHPPFPQYADLNTALAGIPNDAFTILMTHDPAHWDSQIDGKRDINLTLSGHTHGLQWGIKAAGISFSLAYLGGKYWGGLYCNDNRVLYVNTGLGTVGVPWRIDMPAEITVFTLKRSKVY